ncbi:MAG: zinc ribbon domain-containing protein [Clostridiales bacterium]|jgi:ribosomal protein L40E|nr:zinc ribbon domain-containing protein [Clostridiales bacterium]
MSNIPKGRKAAYYIGIAMIALGFILFISVFVSVASHINDPLAFIDGRGTPSFANSIIGIILIIVGSIVMNIGAKGTAGSGLLLDPKKAREDLKPFSEAKGEMINDVISNIDVVDKIIKSNETKEVIKVKCRNCGTLNDEDAKFCKKCGNEL